MKFLATGVNKNNTPLFFAIGFFLFFLLLFWAGNIVLFGLKFGFSEIRIADYFAAGEASLTQILEDAHLTLFVSAILFLSASGLLLHVNISFKLKTFLIASLFISLSLFLIIGIYVFYNPSFAIIFLGSFLFYNLIFLIILLIISYYYLHANLNNKTKSNLYYGRVILFFAIFNFLFALINFYLFREKIGFSLAAIESYYLGNEDLFINPKTNHGLLTTAVMHFGAGGVYLIALTHLITFIRLHLKSLLITLIYISFLIDILVPFFMINFIVDLSLIKLITFIIFQVSIIFASLALITKPLIIFSPQDEK